LLNAAPNRTAGVHDKVSRIIIIIIIIIIITTVHVHAMKA
jgi:hypothetical protein